MAVWADAAPCQQIDRGPSLKDVPLMSSATKLRLIPYDAKGKPLGDVGELPHDIEGNCASTAAMLATAGFSPPWVGYVAIADRIPVGGCAFVGAPKNGQVEIAYYTIEAHHGRGFATRMVELMIEIAHATDSSITLTAKTLPKENASTTILRRTGFQFFGEAIDSDIGRAWEWRLLPV